MKKLISTLLLLLSFSTLANIQAYDDDSFAQLLASNKPVLIDVSAKWCGTCKKQAKIINAYFAEHPNSELTVLKVDYDKQKHAVKQFKAPRQSTLVLYVNGAEVDRIIAQTDRNTLFNMFNKAS